MNPGDEQLLNPDGRLQPGCYYMRFRPNAPYRDGDDSTVEECEGTLRVVHYNNEGDRALTIKQLENSERGQVLFISGDLYAAQSSDFQKIHDDVPIFSRDKYRFYLLATDLKQRGSNQFDLFLTSYEVADGRWNPSSVVAKLSWSQPPEGGPTSDYLAGSVCDADDNEIGEITLYWVSLYLRRAMIEFDRVDNVAPPNDSFTGVDNALLNAQRRHTWQSVFEQCGWKVETKESDQPAEAATKIWTDAELHQAMPSLRDTFDLDTEWRYHIFCVGKLDDGGRGYKFDVSGGESGTPLFESVVLAARYEFADEQQWGPNLAGRTLDTTPAYFRTAVHELGHALKLAHNFSTTGFMSTTDTVRDAAANDKIDFLDAIDWTFALDDLQRLRHWPDLVVRPGGGLVPKFKLPGIDQFRMTVHQGGAPDGSGKVPLEFTVEAFEKEIPLGAPARILLTLTNKGSTPVPAPRLRLKSGNITGWVELPSGEVRHFSPVAEIIDELGVELLGSGKSLKGSLTLLRGPDGPLFPVSGTYKINVDVWYFRDRQFSLLENSATIVVGPIRDDKHRRIADLLLRTKETLVSFAIGGGEGLEDGNQAINLALNNSILRPHYAVLRLKRFCRAIGRVRGSLDEALRLLGEDLKLTPSELEGLIGIVRPLRTFSSEKERSDVKALNSRVLLNNYLRADLRLFGTRILLGNLLASSVDGFRKFLDDKRASLLSNGALSRPSHLLREFMEVSIGLTTHASNELMELLLAYDTSLADAIRSYVADPSDANKMKLWDGSRQIGLSLDTLKKIVGRLREVADSCPDLLRHEELDRSGELIVEAFSETKPGGLYDIFVDNLKQILRGAGIYGHASPGLTPQTTALLLSALSVSAPAEQPLPPKRLSPSPGSPQVVNISSKTEGYPKKPSKR